MFIVQYIGYLFPALHLQWCVGFAALDDDANHRHDDDHDDDDEDDDHDGLPAYSHQVWMTLLWRVGKWHSHITTMSKSVIYILDDHFEGKLFLN